MNESKNWVPWQESAMGKFSSYTLRKWRKRRHHQPPILRREIHWKYGRGNFVSNKIVLINSVLVTPEFVAKHYHQTRSCGSGSGELTKDEVQQIIKLYDNKVPDYLIPACKRFGIPVP